MNNTKPGNNLLVKFIFIVIVVSLKSIPAFSQKCYNEEIADSLFVPVKINGQYCYKYKHTDSIVISGSFDYTEYFYKGKAFVSDSTGYYAINKCGQAVSYYFKHTQPLNAGWGFVQNAEQQYGYINYKGNLLNNCTYDEATPFSCNHAWVKEGDKWRLINSTGIIKTGFTYDYALPFSGNTVAFVIQGDKWNLIDTTGQTCYSQNPEEYIYTSFHKIGEKHIALFTTEHHIIAIDNQHNVLFKAPCLNCFDATYIQADLFKVATNITTPVKTNTPHWALINTSGALLTGFEFDEIGNEIKSGYINFTKTFYDPVRTNRRNRYHGLMNTKGEVLGNYQYYFINAEENGNNSYAIAQKPEFRNGLIFALNKKVSAQTTTFSPDNKIAYMDSTGKILTNWYSSIKPFKNDMATVVKHFRGSLSDNFLYGHINRKGEEVIPTEFKHALDFENELTTAKFVDTARGYAIINKEGEILTEGFRNINKCNKNIWVATYKEYKHAYIDAHTGKQISNYYSSIQCPDNSGMPQAVSVYDSTLVIPDVCTKCHTWGYVTNSGKEILEPVYKTLSPFDNYGFARITNFDDKMMLVDTAGKFMFTEWFEYISSTTSVKTVCIKTDNKYALMNASTGKVVSGWYDVIGQFDYKNNSPVGVVLNNKCGYINVHGKVIIDLSFDNANDFSEGLGAVMKDNMWGYVNSLGRVAIPLLYEEARDFCNHTAAVKQSGSWGFIDKAGQIFINPRYTQVDKFSEDLAAVQVGKKWGYINKSGEVIIQPQFENARAFSGKLAPVKIKGKWGYIDTSGNIIIEPSFDNAHEFSEHLAAVKMENHWGYIDKQGTLIIPFNYLTAEDFKDNRAIARKGKFGKQVTLVCYRHNKKLLWIENP